MATQIQSYPVPLAQDGNNALVQVHEWSEVVILKESSGAVVVGLSADLLPVGSGRGIELPVDQPIRFLAAPGTQIFAMAEAAGEKVGFIVTPVAPLLGMIGNSAGIERAINALCAVAQAVAGR